MSPESGPSVSILRSAQREGAVSVTEFLSYVILK